MTKPVVFPSLLMSGAQTRALGVPPPARPATPPPPLEPGPVGLPPGMPGAATMQGISYERIVFAGGALGPVLQHPNITPFEQLFRKLPQEGWFSNTVSPNNPFVFEIGAFTVPLNMALLLFDLRPDIYRLSGLDAGDYVPVEPRRFSSVLGFDVNVDQKQLGNIQFQLDPSRIEFSGAQAFRPIEGSTNPNLNIATSSSFANVAGVGNALTPQRPERFGAQSIPFTIVARARQTIQIRCVIFRPIPSPVAFIEYDLAGVLAPEKYVEALLNLVKPVVEEAR